ncbi:MAG: catechol 1,2-dioxygenase [Pseudorhodoplanes sp.]|nr:catechol 1,2-dioxygenase [Pseudorhodoplanes sp.]
MIIGDQNDLTEAVLDAFSRTPDPRLREILTALVRHLHGFAREVRLTEEEFHQACNYVMRLGQHSTPSHNEVVLMAGSLGLSSLICLLNNGNKGQTETSASMLGPFWRLNSPRTENGGSIVRSPTPGPELFVKARVRDGEGRPIAGAEVDVWHSSPEGFYENQQESQADMNLRGKFTTDAAGCFAFRSVKPAGYPIPVDGPVGELVRAVRRPHHFRPAHLHFLIYKPGYKTLISQVYASDDERLETDVQFGVTRALIGNFVRHDEDGPAPDVQPPWYSLDYTFVMEPGEAKLPRAPIQ